MTFCAFRMEIEYDKDHCVGKIPFGKVLKNKSVKGYEKNKK